MSLCRSHAMLVLLAWLQIIGRSDKTKAGRCQPAMLGIDIGITGERTDTHPPPPLVPVMSLPTPIPPLASSTFPILPSKSCPCNRPNIHPCPLAETLSLISSFLPRAPSIQVSLLYLEEELRARQQTTHIKITVSSTREHMK